MLIFSKIRDWLIHCGLLSGTLSEFFWIKTKTSAVLKRWVLYMHTYDRDALAHFTSFASHSHHIHMHRSFPSTCPILSKHSYLSTHYNTHIGSDSVDRTNAALVFWNVSHERRTASICVAQTRQSYSGGNVHQSHSCKTTDVGGRRNGGNDSILFAHTVGCQYEAQPSGDSLNPSVATADLLPGCLCAGGRRVLRASAFQK